MEQAWTLVLMEGEERQGNPLLTTPQNRISAPDKRTSTRMPLAT